MRFHIFLYCSIAVLLCATGCSGIQVNPTGRSASDQLLNALSIEDAVNSFEVGEKVRGKVVLLEVETPGIDKDYLEKVLVAWIIQEGGLIARNGDQPDLTFRVLAQSTGSDKEISKFAIPVILPSLQTGFTTSQIEFGKTDIQVSRCQLWAYAIDKKGRFLFKQPPVYASHYISNTELLGLSLGKSSDLKELQKNVRVLPDVEILPSNF